MNDPNTKSIDDLLRLVPQVLRARGWRLYTAKSSVAKDSRAAFRLVDLWQYGGRAILGHTPPGVLRAIKNNAERGLFAALPHVAEQRFYKALSAILPGYSFRFYPPEDLPQLLQKIPLIINKNKTAVWRPFLDVQEGNRANCVCDALAGSVEVQLKAPVLLPVLPCPFPGVPAVIAFNPDDTALLELPPSRLMSPVSLAAATRAIYDLLVNPGRGQIRFPKIENSLKKSAAWKQQGIYLSFVGSPNNYTAVFTAFLEKGFLLPPSAEDPAILPGELSPGEEAKLAAALEGTSLCSV
jgi:hypothetical protein